MITTWRSRIELTFKLIGITALAVGLSGTPLDSRAEQGTPHDLAISARDLYV